MWRSASNTAVHTLSVCRLQTLSASSEARTDLAVSSTEGLQQRQTGPCLFPLYILSKCILPTNSDSREYSFVKWVILPLEGKQAFNLFLLRSASHNQPHILFLWCDFNYFYSFLRWWLFCQRRLLLTHKLMACGWSLFSSYFYLLPYND